MKISTINTQHNLLNLYTINNCINEFAQLSMLNINIKEDKHILKVMLFSYQHVLLFYKLCYEEQDEISFQYILYYLDFVYKGVKFTFKLLSLVSLFQSLEFIEINKENMILYPIHPFCFQFLKFDHLRYLKYHQSLSYDRKKFQFQMIKVLLVIFSIILPLIYFTFYFLFEIYFKIKYQTIRILSKNLHLIITKILNIFYLFQQPRKVALLNYHSI
ncbi:unnamed protein product [Paramecium sonneborni]|uniref:Transmembrane protein n=1 Tax=Paramecium sonneborni TaxID=65129 RepID=A0A8S1PSR0_9CILI|nr:unnamed protein product [Paramecium sonneborni]